jgi:hypothetical protein
MQGSATLPLTALLFCLARLPACSLVPLRRVHSAALCIKQPGKRTSLSYMDLSKSTSGPTEVCFELLGFRDKTTGQALLAKDSNTPGGPNSWFFHLFNIRFVLKPDDGSATAVAVAEQMSSSDGTSTSPSSSSSSSSVELLEVTVPAGLPEQVITEIQPEPPQYQHFNATADMIEFERRVRAAATAADIIVGSAAAAAMQDAAASSPEGSGSSSSSSSSSSRRRLFHVPAGNGTTGACRQQQVWEHLQQRHDWPDGQVVFESMYHPCEMLSPGSCVEMCGHD